LSGYVGKADNGLARGANNLVKVNGDEIDEMWKDLGKTFSGDMFTANKEEMFKIFTPREDRKGAITDAPSKITCKKVSQRTNRKYVNTVLSAKKARHRNIAAYSHQRGDTRTQLFKNL
jgi:hypothetical protein